MTIKIIKPSATTHLNMLFYGLTNAGKTHLCGTIAEVEEATPALLLDIEGGTLTLSSMISDDSGLDVTRPRRWSEIQEIYDYFRHENDRYKCILVDSVTEVQRMLSMGNIMEELSGDAAYEDLGRAIAPERRDWLRSSEQMRKFFRAFRDLAYHPDEEKRVHVVITALEKMDEKKGLVCPQLPGQLGVEAGSFVDILGRLSQVRVENEDGEIEERRHLLTDDHTDDVGTRYLAKNRGNKLGRGIWNPTMSKIIGAWSE